MNKIEPLPEYGSYNRHVSTVSTLRGVAWIQIIFHQFIGANPYMELKFVLTEGINSCLKFYFSPCGC